MVDPYVPLLFETMDCRYTLAIRYSIKALVVLVELQNVPSVAAMIESIVPKVFSLLLVRLFLFSVDSINAANRKVKIRS